MSDTKTKAINNETMVIINKVIENPDALTDDEFKTLNAECPVVYKDLIVLRKRIAKNEKDIEELMRIHHIHEGKKKYYKYTKLFLVAVLTVFPLSCWLAALHFR